MEKTKTRKIERSSPETELPQPTVELRPEFGAGVRVIYGAGVQAMPLEGMTVAQAREAMATVLGVDRRSPALINGRPARPDYRIRSTDELEFVHHAGGKG